MGYYKRKKPGMSRHLHHRSREQDYKCVWRCWCKTLFKGTVQSLGGFEENARYKVAELSIFLSRCYAGVLFYEGEYIHTSVSLPPEGEGFDLNPFTSQCPC